MTWRLARGLEKLRSQVNERWPNRSKDSDGSIGDEHHSARASDHNPDEHGVVHAIDITHDPKGGFDSYAFADYMLKKQDHRISYIISNRRIGSGPRGTQPGVWRKYSGINPHDHHCHVSIVSGQLADDTSPWDIAVALGVEPDVVAAYVPPPPTLRKGSSGEYVKLLQSKLGFSGSEIDGDFGINTDRMLRVTQAAYHLTVDGIAGPQTWAVLT